VSARHIDWAALRRNLDEAQRRLATSFGEDDDRRAALLRKRARRLGASAKVSPAAGSRTTVMTFLLGTERYALELSALSQVFPLRGLVAVAGAPEKVLGVMSLRGEVGTIWDLGRLLGLPRPAGSLPGHLLVLKQRTGLGLAVDYVEGTREIEDEAVASRDEVPLALPFLRGFTGERIHLLDAGALAEGLGAEIEALGGADDR
jgi:purine-binding chemotaxis protein CheW